MKKHTIEHNGFHGYNSVSILLPDEAREGDAIEVSERVAQRINAAVCGSVGCVCGERIAHQTDYDRWAVALPKHGEIIRGHYPQN